MTSTIEKRQSLHRQVKRHAEKTALLSKEVDSLSALASIGSATAMIAHEINNLLTPIVSYATLALKNPGDEKLVEKVLKQTYENCRQASKVVEAILAVSNGQKQEKQLVGVRELIEKCFCCLCRDFSRDGITVKVEVPGDLTVFAEPVKLQQVLLNLILNAREAMLDTGGTLVISGKDEGELVVLSVRDNGCGIETQNLKKVFDPFFTTKMGEGGGKRGSGLGLSFCRKIIEEHGGTISVESKPQAGSTFEIRLPRERKGSDKQWPNSAKT